MKKPLTIFFCFSLLLLTTAPALADSPFYEGDDSELDEEFIYDNMFFSLENEEQLAADRAPNEIIIKFRDASEVPGHEKQLQKEIDKVKKIGFVEALDVYVVNVDDLEKNPNAVLNRFKNNRFIEYVEPNYLFDFNFIPNDPNYSTLATALGKLNAPAGWDIARGNNSPLVAIIDSGMASHPDLPAPVKTYSAVSNLAYNNDKAGHGTMVAGTFGALGNNGIGTTGINMNAKIMVVKVDDALASLSVANISKGVTWAADNGAKVISMSVGSSADSSTLKSAVDYAYKMDRAIFVATGNDSKNAISFPARYSSTMAVGATTNGTNRVAYSNYGPEMDVVAYGSYISTTASGGYLITSGTSFAAPQVAGLASLVYEVFPTATAAEVYSLIRQGANPLGGGFNTETGYGLIDIGKTLSLASAKAAPAAPKPIYTTPPTITLTGFSEVSLFVGDTYQETGYKAVDCLGVDITKDVAITGTVNTAKAGINTLTYSVSDAGGNSAKATRTVNVEAKPVVIVPPTLTVNGSNPIIIHIDSGTPYLEQGAKAIDSDGKDISASVSISGSPDRYKAGTYTVTYTATGKDGGVATATRSVHIITATSEVAVRSSYNLNEKAKQGAMITHTGVVAGGSGFLDLKLASIDKNMKVSIQFINTATRTIAFRDTFSAAGSTQYRVNQGKYDMVVMIDQANGNSQYSFNLLTPEIITYEFDQKEVSY